MKKIIASATAFLLLLSFGAHSQALSSEDIKAQLIKEWERAKSYTGDYLNAMPADKYGFKAVDSIRSFAQQMLHLSQGNMFLMGNATDQTPPPAFKSDLEHSATAQSKDSVVAYVNASYDFCINAIKTLDVNKWGEKKKFANMDVSRFALVLKTFEHQTHHRGQATIYIRLLGIRPPQERLF